jgi:uroporphyrinogen decarboxylase
MTSRERMERALTGSGLPDRIPLCETSIWPETRQRWLQEGLPEGVDPLVWMGMDRIRTIYPDSTLRYPTETLSEDEETVVWRDENGAVMRRWKNKTAVRVMLEPLVKTPDDWRAQRPRLLDMAGRVADNYAQVVADAAAQDMWVAICPREPMWFMLMLMGFEGGLPMILDYPDVVADIIHVQTEISLYAVRTCLERARPDALWYFSDLCYRGGMLFSPATYRELVMPQVKRVTQACHDAGMATMYHCDGNVSELIPLLIETGFDCIQPLEARAGNDVRELCPRYGRQIAMFGNINVDRLSSTPEEAEEEVRMKVSAAAPGGRYLFHSDHSVPPSVPLANYRLAVETARRLGSFE